MYKRTGKIYPFSFTYPAVAIYLVFFVLPTLTGFFYSFTDWNIDGEKVSFVGFENFSYLFTDEYFVLALKNTLIFGIITAFFKMFFGLFLAVGVNKPLFSKYYLRTIFYLPGVLSLIVVGIMFSSVFQMDGILNSFIRGIGFKDFSIDWLGNVKTAFGCVIVMEIWKWSGFCMIIFLAGLQNIPKEYYEASMIDGASSTQQFRSITLPLLMPAFTVNVTINLIGGFKVFEQVYVLTRGGPANSTQVLNTMVFQAFSEGLYGKGSAMGLILFVFIALVSMLISGCFKRREVEL